MSLKYFIDQNRGEGTVKSTILYYQGSFSAEFDALPTRMSHMRLNTTFPYVHQQSEPFQVIKVS